MKSNRAAIRLTLTIVVSLCLLLSGCNPRLTAAPTLTATSVPATILPTYTAVSTLAPSPTSPAVALPALTLEPANFYFSLDGQPAFILSRNLTGNTKDDFSSLLEWAHQGDTRVIRIHIITGWGVPWINRDWSINEQWAQDWDGFFDQAQADGIFIIPVFGVWADWNDGKPADVYHFWQYNPLNVANSGPLTSPTGLFQTDSDTQKHWMAWVQAMVKRWQGRQNIAAWEIFSEINLASGALGDTDAKGAVSETAAVDFTNKAAAIIRAADTSHRPVTLSLAVGAPFTDEWAKFYENNTLDFIEIHPYSDQLDRELVSDIQKNIIRYNRPVMIGESGLWSMAHNANASIGIEHAIWAGLVSGAMNGRALWENDGYALYSSKNPTDAMQFMQSYATTGLPVARFVDGIDFTGFQPLNSVSSSGVWGAAVGNERSIIGWYRDADSEPPDWNLQPLISKQTVSLTVPGSATSWKVDFYNTKDGTTILGSGSVTRIGNIVNISLPDFQDDIAFKMTAQAGTASTSTHASTSAPAIVTTDTISGTWSGTISNTTKTFSTPVKLSIQAGCRTGTVCGTFSAPQISCSGDLYLQAISAQTFFFLEQNASGSSSCQSGGYEQLQLLADGTLSSSYLITPGSAASSTGILKKP